MFIYVPEPKPREGIAPALEVQIRTHLSGTAPEPAGGAVTISSPQYETFIAQCAEALQRDKSIDLEVAPASAGDAETITIVNDSGITVEDMRGRDFEVDGLVVLEGFFALRDEGLVLG